MTATLCLAALFAAASDDDMKLSVRPAQAVFAAGGAPEFVFTFDNPTKEPVRLFNKGLAKLYADDNDLHSRLRVRATAVEGGKVWMVRCQAEISRAGSVRPGFVVEPGKSESINLAISGHLRFAPDAGGKPVDALPPGKYKLEVECEMDAPVGSTERFWIGRLKASAEFTVKAP